jgi:flagellar motor protein MotB
MRRPLVLVVLVACLGPHQANAQPQVVAEYITFLQPDGRQYVLYETVRSSLPTYDLYFPKTEANEKDVLAPFLYIYPNEHRWDSTSNPHFNLLRFPEGSRAMMRTGVFSNRVTIGEDGNHRFTSWDGVVAANGHFGIWNVPGPFTKIACVWVFPDNFEIVKYESNRPGEWVVRQSTLAYYGTNVNDLAFTLTYRPRSRGTFDALSKALREQPMIEVKQLERGVMVTAAATLLFAPGRSNLSAAGRTALSALAEQLIARPSGRIAIEGHTDSTPITGALASMYATNWELSAARALAVVQYLARRGVSEALLEARAYGATRPRAPNTSDRDRELNRRIEIVVSDASGERQTR